MENRFRKALIVPLILALSGCANLMSIDHRFNVDSGDSISIDAKQRVVFSVLKTYKKHGLEWRAVCAEPSPDALSAISASAGVSAEVLQKALSAAFQSSESAASIGLRTQTIQLLRDAMYRLCEGYASGALDDIAFSRLQRRYQNIMMGLLAIEQLTGVVTARQVVLSTSASASVARNLVEIQKVIDDAQKVVRDREGTVAIAQKAADSAKQENEKQKQQRDELIKQNNNDPKAPAVKKFEEETLAKSQKDLDSANSALAARQRELADAKKNLAGMEALRDNARKTLAEGAAQGAFDSGTTIIRPGTGNANVSDKVVEIVRAIVDRDYTKESCLDFMTSRTFQEPENYRIAVTFCAYMLAGEAEKNIAKSQEKALDSKSKEDLMERAQSLKAFSEAMQRALSDFEKKQKAQEQNTAKP